MPGGNAWNIVQYWRSRTHRLQVLKERVQRGQVLYIGSSGGSVSAGLDMKYCEDDRSGLGDVDMKGLPSTLHHYSLLIYTPSSLNTSEFNPDLNASSKRDTPPEK